MVWLNYVLRSSRGKRRSAIVCFDHYGFRDQNLDLAEASRMAPCGRCYECFRPRDACFCRIIPKIANRIDVVILQHRKERFHPFNTARIAHRSLSRSQLLVDRPSNLAARLRLQPRAALLFPLEPARLLSDITADERPQQLVILDGTWHQAKSLLRDIPVLQTLPRFRLAPSAPSRYRIRREPSDTALSTVEATVAALRILEPETAGLEQLVRAFDTMVEDQLGHPGSAHGSRFQQRRPSSVPHVPHALMGSLDHIVVAYGEATPGERETRRTNAQPVSWVAQRLGDGATFSHTLIPPRPLDDAFLRHVELNRTDFVHAISLEEARQRWATFRRPKDVVVVFQPGTARLLTFLAGDTAPCLVLKSVAWKALAGQLSVDAPPAESTAVATRTQGRGGKRLAETIALVRRVNALGRMGV